ncbi:DUF4833 domain-containing protein [Saprospiraceae bacterium]|nr:DUF4833 domain-containing protein [Saprospiraceae bacterium]
MIYNLDKAQYNIFGEDGLPESYPIPESTPNLLFYIQRNLNKNTVIYAANINKEGRLNESYPIKVYWIKYSEDGHQAKLNLLQEKAFGYISNKINDRTYEVKMSSYDKQRMFLSMNDNGRCSIVTKINGQDSQLSNIYVYADELGIFPQLKFIELYGYCEKNQLPIYQRIIV